MSYGASAALQAAVFGVLQADPDLSSAVNNAIFDTAPSGTAPETFVALGPEEVNEASDGTGLGSVHDFQVFVVTEATGFLNAKIVAGRISDILTTQGLVLDRGHIVSLRFLRAKARRVITDDTRRVDMWFRARVADDI